MERQPIEALINNPDIITKSGNKGRGIVILNKSDYLEEASRILSDTYCESLSYDPSPQFLLDYNKIIDDAFLGQIITNKDRFFKEKEPQNAHFLLPPQNA